MTVCGATRLLVPGVLVGATVTSVTGSEPAAWAAAALTVGALLATQRRRGAGAACAIPPTGAAPRPAPSPIEPSDDIPSPT
jgi:MYXO-CTERM domain-containing protein